MIYERSIEQVEPILAKYKLEKLVEGVTWLFTNAKSTQSCYVLYEDAIYLHPKDARWSWSYGRTNISNIYHEIGHRFFEKFLTRRILREKEIVEIFGYYHQKYIRDMQGASRATRKDMFDYVSRYSLVHAADDESECFAVCLDYITKDKNPEDFVKEHNKSEVLLKKIKIVIDLINRWLKSEEKK